MSYMADLEATATAAVKALQKYRIDPARLKFGGAKEITGRIIVPSFADSKFQAEQALGDWAEGALANAINTEFENIKAVHYGFSSKIIAGEVGFAEQYTEGLRDTHRHGKRGDLLILPKKIQCATDISSVETLKTKDIVSKSIGALEVRSSRLEAMRYIEYKKAKSATGKKDANPTPNFTVKIEDLIIVYRWIEFFKRPQAYAQVFLDVVYGISFLEILKYIATAKKLTIIKPARSGKITIMIPITEGTQIGTVVEYPKFQVVDRLTANGRHDIYARPSAGKIELVEPKLLLLLK